jgi:hypothetical protein
MEWEGRRRAPGHDKLSQGQVELHGAGRRVGHFVFRVQSLGNDALVPLLFLKKKEKVQFYPA